MSTVVIDWISSKLSLDKPSIFKDLDKRFEDNYIRTPLGGFVNHSDVPNCEFYIEDDYIMLRTIRHINQGNELTAEYWLYDIDKMEDKWIKK